MKDKEILKCDRNLVNQLQQACEGLLWLSESEYPWETIYWDNLSDLTPQTLLQQIDYEPRTRIEIIDLEEFFAQATQIQDWHEAVEIEEVERYQNLVQIVQENLEDIKVYEVGEVEIDVYILGKTKNNAITGLKTKVIAT